MEEVVTKEPITEQKNNADQELNFRRQEKMYQQRMKEMEAAHKAEIERLQQEASSRHGTNRIEEYEEDDEPYVDSKKLKRELNSFKSQLEQDFEKRAEAKARSLLQQDKQQNWLKQHADFYDVMQHAEKFAQEYPDLAEDILSMPEGFERQKLVYRNIKSLKVHEPKKDEPSIQQKIDANRRSPYYQPSGVASAPYGNVATGKAYSPAEQKNAFEQMQQLKSRLRLS